MLTKRRLAFDNVDATMLSAVLATAPRRLTRQLLELSTIPSRNAAPVKDDRA